VVVERAADARRNARAMSTVYSCIVLTGLGVAASVSTADLTQGDDLQR
jgi:hypothetical protein